MTPSLNIIDALDDPDYFGPLFARDTWACWRVFLKALFGLGGTMTGAERELFQHHTGRHEPPTQPFAEAALVIGRRGGKSRMLALIAVFLATFRDYDEYIAPGEIPTIAIIAADRKQARVILHYCRGLLQSVALLAPLLVDEMVESLKLKSGVVIEVHSGRISSPRGRTMIAVLGDEIAFWRTDDDASNPDTEVIAAVRPALATIPGSMLLIASSPYAKRGVLYSTFRRHWGHDGSRTLVWRGKSLEMNPSLDPAIVEAAREEDPAAAASEYDAEFRDDIAQFVPREVIDACTVPDRRELLPASKVNYFAAVDPSGGSSDSMTLGIAHEEGGATVLDAIREVRPPFSPEAVVADFAALLKSYRIRTVVGDRYGGEWCREPFRGHGIEYQLAELSASEIFRDALPLLTSGNAQLLDLPRLSNQLAALERRTSRSGRDLISHPPGGHDDIAVVACSALLLCKSARRPIQISPEFLERISKLKPRPGERFLFGPRVPGGFFPR
ncbi:MAG TPA: hypothetical protein VL997_12760 [Dyella sp.]|nr:hypothetical protein [Dyella sp.]